MKLSLLLVLPLLLLRMCATSDDSGLDSSNARRGTSPVAPPAGATKVPANPAPNLQLVTTTFKVEGMDCADCSKAIEGKLIGLPGVSTVSADQKAGTAIVQYDAGKISSAELIAAIDALKFKASLAKP